MAEAQVSVAVLGAAGTIAPAIVHDLGESGEVASMVLLDLDPGKAAAVADEHGHGKATAARVDARDVDALAGAIAGAGAGVLLNTASYRINLDAMRACLKAGCHYLDLGGLYHVTGEQLELGAEFERAGRLAVLGIGSSPGKTNLMAADAVRRLNAGGIESIDVFAAGRDSGGAGRRTAPPPVRDPDADRRADTRARRPRGRERGRDRATQPRRERRLRRSDRRRRDDLHAALRARDVRRELRLQGGELSPVPRARAARPAQGARGRRSRRDRDGRPRGRVAVERDGVDSPRQGRRRATGGR